MGRSRAVFLDLRGTPGEGGRGDIMDLALCPFAAEAIKLLNEAGLLAIVITNQSGIAWYRFTHQEC
ncbi:MAG: hypothetical protein HPY83_13790 [Anaerolineae bacterium]|nr:hypothetical protein [Anaerolineae bacterium]